MNYPKISVITPTFNHGKYIEQTILSVLGQGYPNLEYIVIDGGSSDNTVEIIKNYESQITYWVSEKDGGQSNAINKGFEQATGDILCWLNSDDYYLPNILIEVAKTLCPNNAELLYGNCIHLNEQLNQTHGSYFNPFTHYSIYDGDFIVQPSSFWTRKAWEITGKLREDFHFGFDWEWYARATTAGVKFIPSSVYFSIYRVHDQQKSDPNDLKRSKELLQILKLINPKKIEKLATEVNKKRRLLSLTERIFENSILKRFKYRSYKLIYPKIIAITGIKELRDYLHFESDL